MRWWLAFTKTPKGKASVFLLLGTYIFVAGVGIGLLRKIRKLQSLRMSPGRASSCSPVPAVLQLLSPRAVPSLPRPHIAAGTPSWPLSPFVLDSGDLSLHWLSSVTVLCGHISEKQVTELGDRTPHKWLPWCLYNHGARTLILESMM